MHHRGAGAFSVAAAAACGAAAGFTGAGFAASVRDTLCVLLHRAGLDWQRPAPLWLEAIRDAGRHVRGAAAGRENLWQTGCAACNSDRETRLASAAETSYARDRDSRSELNRVANRAGRRARITIRVIA